MKELLNRLKNNLYNTTKNQRYSILIKVTVKETNSATHETTL